MWGYLFIFYSFSNLERGKWIYLSVKFEIESMVQQIVCFGEKKQKCWFLDIWWIQEFYNKWSRINKKIFLFELYQVYKKNIIYY